jgi:hypothetical protein
MNKKEILKVLDIASLVSIVIATVLVLLFEFTGLSLLVRYSIVFYTASFLIAIVFFSLRLYYGRKKYSENSEHAIFEFQSGQKAFTITKLVFVSIAFVVSFVVLILY